MLRRQHGKNATQATEPLLRDLIKVMMSLRAWDAEKLSLQGIDPDLLVAQAWGNLGYWQFDSGLLADARQSFRHSLKEKLTLRALLYGILCSMPANLVYGLRQIKQRIAGTGQAIVKKAQKNQKPARILYVENGIGYGGAIICLRHLVRNLDRTRFDPMVITGRTGPDYEEIASEARWKHIPDRRIDVVGMKRGIERSAWVKHIPGLYFITQPASVPAG